MALRLLAGCRAVYFSEDGKTLFQFLQDSAGDVVAQSAVIPLEEKPDLERLVFTPANGFDWTVYDSKGQAFQFRIDENDKLYQQKTTALSVPVWIQFDSKNNQWAPWTNPDKKSEQGLKNLPERSLTDAKEISDLFELKMEREQKKMEAWDAYCQEKGEDGFVSKAGDYGLLEAKLAEDLLENLRLILVEYRITPDKYSEPERAAEDLSAVVQYFDGVRDDLMDKRLRSVCEAIEQYAAVTDKNAMIKPQIVQKTEDFVHPAAIKINFMLRSLDQALDAAYAGDHVYQAPRVHYKKSWLNPTVQYALDETVQDQIDLIMEFPISNGLKKIFFDKAISEKCSVFNNSLDKLYSACIDKTQRVNIKIPNEEKSISSNVRGLDLVRAFKAIHDLYFNSDVKISSDPHIGVKPAVTHYFGRIGTADPRAIQEAMRGKISVVSKSIAVDDEWIPYAGKNTKWRSGLDLPYRQQADYVPAMMIEIINLSEDERYAFAMQHADDIQNVDQLCRVLRLLPLRARSSFAKNQEYQIQDGEELARVLWCIPEDEGLDFAERNINKIQYDMVLPYVLDALPNYQRFNFANNHKDMILTSEHLIEVAILLSMKERFEFVKRHADKICDFDQIIFWVKTFPSDEDRFEFINRYHYKIRTSEQLFEALCCLSRGAAYKLLRGNTALLYSTDNFMQVCQVLYTVPEETWEKLLAIELSDAIKNFDELCYLLNRCSDKNIRFDLVKNLKCLQDLICDGDELGVIAKYMFPHVRVEFIKSQAYKIRNIDHLITIMQEHFPFEKRSELAKLCVDKIQDADQLCSVMKKIDLKSRLDLAEMYGNKIQNRSELDAICSCISPSPQYDSDLNKFLKIHGDRIDAVNRREERFGQFEMFQIQGNRVTQVSEHRLNQSDAAEEKPPESRPPKGKN